MSSEHVPLLNNNSSSIVGSSQANPQYKDQLPSYTESTGHIVLSMNIPAPPPYTYAGQVTTRTESNREYPAGQILAFGLYMLIGAAILYAFKHGL